MLVGGPGDVELRREADGGLGLVAEPVLVAASVPIAQVHLGEGIGKTAVLLEFEDDVAVAQAVFEHLVHSIAEGLGKAGDLAVAGMAVPAETGVNLFDQTEEIGRLGGWRNGVMKWWVHRMVEGLWLRVEGMGASLDGAHGRS